MLGSPQGLRHCAPEGWSSSVEVMEEVFTSSDAALGNDAVVAWGLVKDFGTTRALDHLDLTVHTGEVHGFLGPNGAGKTTTIRILLGLLRASGGRVALLGGDPWR